MSSQVSKVRSLTLDILDPLVLSLFSAVGNEFANAVLEKTLPDGTKISEAADRSDRDSFIRRKYENCEFVDVTQIVDVESAIKQGDVRAVYVGLCQMKKLKQANASFLKLATAYGNVQVALLIALNDGNPDSLDEGGWSALSYAAYFGQLPIAQALLSIGCNPNASPTAHPFEVATSQGNPNLSSLFLPYWTTGEVERKTFVPPLRFHETEALPSPPRSWRSSVCF
jgi:hypothetical protein